jgi:hypothetical protein
MLAGKLTKVGAWLSSLLDPNAANPGQDQALGGPGLGLGPPSTGQIDVPGVGLGDTAQLGLNDPYQGAAGVSQAPATYGQPLMAPPTYPISYQAPAATHSMIMPARTYPPESLATPYAHLSRASSDEYKAPAYGNSPL